MPSLQELATNLPNYQYYSGLGAFRQNRLPFGNDTVGGGNSGQPFIVRNIDQRWSPSNFNDGFTQFGAVTTLTRTAADVSRITQLMYTTPQGNQFLLKQTGLQRMNPNTEADAYKTATNTVDTQIYNPLGLSTLAQVGINASGLHLKKHGVLPGFSDGQGYEKMIRRKEEEGDDRLVSLSVQLSKGDVDYLLKYTGGPGSFMGIGNTTIGRYSRMMDPFTLKKAAASGDNQGFIPLLTGGLISISGDTVTGRSYTIDNPTGVGPDEVYGTNIQPGQPLAINLKNQDFRVLKNALKKAELGVDNDAYTALPQTDYQKYNLERRIGVARVRRPDQRTSYTSNADTADRINAISLYYADGPAVTTTDVNGNPVNNEDIPESSIRDIVKFRIKILDNDRRTVANGNNFGTYIIFRAYLTNVRRNVVSKWDPYKYVGRGESFYAYDGFTETVTYSFTIAASSRMEMKPIYQKLNYLISSMTPDYRDNLMRGNIAELTIGDFLLYQPGIITNLDMLIDEDTNWEIAMSEPENGGDEDMHELPHMIRCNMTFIPIYNFLPRKSSETPFIGVDGLGESKAGKRWLRGTNANLK